MSGKVTNEAIRNLLRNMAPQAITNAEIREGLGCNEEEAHYISPRIRGMAKNPRWGIGVTMKGDRLAWYDIAGAKGVHDKPAKKKNRAALVDEFAAVAKKHGISRLSNGFKQAIAALTGSAGKI